MEVTEVKENEDGSADFMFDMTDEEAELLFKAGLKAAQEGAEKFAEIQYEKARSAIIELGIITGISRGIQQVYEEKTTSAKEA